MQLTTYKFLIPGNGYQQTDDDHEADGQEHVDDEGQSEDTICSGNSSCSLMTMIDQI